MNDIEPSLSMTPDHDWCAETAALLGQLVPDRSSLRPPKVPFARDECKWFIRGWEEPVPGGQAPHRPLRAPGPSLGEMLMLSLRQAAGPLEPKRPWLRSGDWDFAFKSHFDFVVHAH